MNRAILDKLISSTGLIVAVVLLAGGGGLAYAHDFIHSQVRTQLAAEKITFPAAGSAAEAGGCASRTFHASTTARPWRRE